MKSTLVSTGGVMIVVGFCWCGGGSHWLLSQGVVVAVVVVMWNWTCALDCWRQGFVCKPLCEDYEQCGLDHVRAFMAVGLG